MRNDPERMKEEVQQMQKTDNCMDLVVPVHTAIKN